jgi:hypothetical protein
MTLDEQNNAESWRDCEDAGLPHRLGPPEVVRSLYGGEQFTPPSTIRRCQRCPAGFMDVPRG